MLTILHAVEEHVVPYDHFAISADLQSLHLPNIGVLSVPITVRVSKAHGPAPQRIDFAFEATDKSALFPAFAGSLRCDPDGPSSSTIWLIGEYTPPLGFLGGLLDRTMLHNLATRTLTPLLETLAAAAQSAGRSHEEAFIRAERFNQ
ncbi:MAG: hypothetical protein M3N19_08670 [Candidatus Eremiobacteraeota bacterium]|nr:hypothetical protein [Candidatus Eremiobacteraeota bacterium]